MSGNHAAIRYAVVQSSYDLAVNSIADGFASTADPASVVDDREEAFRTGSEDELVVHEPRVPSGSPDVVQPGNLPCSKEKRSHRRARKRKFMAEASGSGNSQVKEVAMKKARAMAGNDDATPTLVTAAKMKVAEGGWLGHRAPVKQGDVQTLDDLLESGYTLVNWDGVMPHAILDASGKVIVVLAGRASGTFDDVIRDATAEFRRQSEKLIAGNASHAKRASTRGRFHVVTTGISYGGGQKVPMQTQVPAAYADAATQLSDSLAMKRLAGFQSQTFKTYFPKIHAYYVEKLSKLYGHFPALRRPYETSTMPAAAFNLGPATVCRPHRDSANLSFGICSVTALGNYDPKKGGHLAFEELRLVAVFPPGSTAHFPSALLTHSNTNIGQGETRYSFTQYAAGTLFSFVDNGMRSNKQVMESLSRNSKEFIERVEAGRNRWEEKVLLFPKITDY